MSSPQSHHQALELDFDVPVPIEHEDGWLAGLNKSINEARKPLMLAATVGAGTAFWSALHPPGGYWRHDKAGHAAGDPVMPIYETFRMLTAMAFMASLVLVLLLSSERFYRTWGRMAGVLLVALLDVACFFSAMVVASDPSDPIRSPVLYLATVFVLAFLYLGAPRAWNLARRCW